MVDQKKRIVVLSDGTWSDKEGDSISNVAELDHLIAKGECSDGVRQVVMYDVGIGIEGRLFSRLLGGGIGRGIDTNIKELYLFIAQNYQPGDEIYMFGWSRGAYTVRSLCGMIYEAGLVTGSSVSEDKADEAYRFYRSNQGANSPDAKAFREENGERVPVAVLGCFDTVGALGVPWFYFLNKLKYSFHDTTVCPNVALGVHAVSVDDDVKGFEPTPMTSERPGQVVEKYFAGNHSGVGGGTVKELAYIALNFVIDTTRSAGYNLEYNQAIPAGDPKVGQPKEGQFNPLRLLTGKLVREITDIDQLHDSVRVRYRSLADYRPEALNNFRDELLK